MRTLLGLLMLVVMSSDVFDLDLSLVPGVSARNAVLNIIALGLAIRFVIKGNFKLEIPTIVASYAVMFLYAALSIIIAAMVIQYPHYEVRGSILTLKENIVDPALLLLTFFYGTRSVEDSKVLTRVLLAAFTLASFFTITDVYGFTSVGHMEYGANDLDEASRPYGFFGHANETGALIALLLPAYVAVAMGEKGAIRLGWLVAMMISVVVLIITGSRGAIAGLVFGGACAAFMCRKYLSPAKLLRAGMTMFAIGLPIIAVVGAKYGGEFVNRIVSQSSSADIGDLSSGRTELWARSINRMMETPISLITGFGWNVYNSMGYFLPPHSHYILLWFELGLVGLACYLIIIRSLIRTAMSGMRTATPDSQRYLIAMVFSIMILSVAILFEQLFKPWYYIWPYVGITLRIAVLAQQERSATKFAAKKPSSRLTAEVPAARVR